MNRNESFPKVIFTDDGWMMSTQPPVTAQDLCEKIVGSYADTGPLTVLAADCRQRGITFFPRVRMNSHYVIDPAHPGYGRFRRERPELLIGRPGEVLPEGSLEWAIRSGKDYAFAQVRQYMERVICETFERFDVDGVELDFMRHPGWFRIEATRHIDERHLRALASRWYEDGAEGVYLYNFYTMSPDWNERVFKELTDPGVMARRDKIHGTDSAGPVSPVEGHAGGFRYASPSTRAGGWLVAPADRPSVLGRRSHVSPHGGDRTRHSWNSM
jgi:hypothetical protein